MGRALRIVRIRVEEGFLSGLDLLFEPGLNALIGPRGSGKTSIIELLRFCLDVSAYSRSVQARASQHAMSVLGSGRVVVTVEDSGKSIEVSRSSEDPPDPVLRQLPDLPLILSQNEIESIGLESRGKLRLIDGFSTEPEDSENEQNELLSEISSLTTQIQTANEEQQELLEQIAPLANISKELRQAREQEASLLQSVKAAGKQRAQMERLAKATAAHSVKDAVFERSLGLLYRWQESMEEFLSEAPELEEWPESAGEEDELEPVRDALDDVVISLEKVQSALAVTISKCESTRVKNKATSQKLENQARDLRQRLEALQEGAGSLSHKVSELSERRGQLVALKALQSQKAKSLERIRANRDMKLSGLDAVRQRRFSARRQVAISLSERLQPLISVQVEQAALRTAYEHAIAESLRGSGLRYRELAPTLASSLSPRELVHAIEKGDPKTIAQLAKISTIRAQRIIDRIRSGQLDEILTAQVEDGAIMSLLVGNDYRAIDRISTGQRCTVILPILLSAQDRALVVDQPEDHLDNAFIVDTVIKSLLERGTQGQLICATHNPNIPVLGEARRVILLDSDGNRGFVRHAEKLDHPKSVNAITRVMEGGRDAFERRAAFYESSSQDNEPRPSPDMSLS